MAILGLNPFGSSKKGKPSKKAAAKAYTKMKAVKKKSKSCEFC